VMFTSRPYRYGIDPYDPPTTNSLTIHSMDEESLRLVRSEAQRKVKSFDLIWRRAREDVKKELLLKKRVSMSAGDSVYRYDWRKLVRERDVIREIKGHSSAIMASGRTVGLLDMRPADPSKVMTEGAIDARIAGIPEALLNADD
jgi:hypothetical protein